MSGDLEDKIFDALGAFWWTKTRGGLAKRVSVAVTNLFANAQAFEETLSAMREQERQAKLARPAITPIDATKPLPLVHIDLTKPLGDGPIREAGQLGLTKDHPRQSGPHSSPAKSKPKAKKKARSVKK